MSWIVKKNCPGEIFLMNPAASLAFSLECPLEVFRIFCYGFAPSLPCTGTLIESGFVEIDSTLGEMRDSDSSFITGLPVLENE